jgi:hypothetical protein
MAIVHSPAPWVGEDGLRVEWEEIKGALVDGLERILERARYAVRAG